MTLQEQFTTITYMVLAGIYLGMALETFRRFSPIFKQRKVLVYCLEVCFWLMQTFILFYILYLANYGELRLYVFLACLLGFSIYKALLAPSYQKILEFLIRLILWIYELMKKIIRLLLINPIKWLLSVLLKILLGFLTVVIFLIKLFFLPIKWLGQLIYWLLPEKIQQFFNKFPQFYSIIKNTIKKWLKFFKGR